MAPPQPGGDAGSHLEEHWEHQVVLQVVVALLVPAPGGCEGNGVKREVDLVDVNFIFSFPASFILVYFHFQHFWLY